MKVKKVLFILTILFIFVLNSTNVFALRPRPVQKEVYNSTSLAISIIMKAIVFIIFIAYVVFFIAYLIKSKKEKREKIKKLIKWLIITTILSLILLTTSEYVKQIGKSTTTDIYSGGSADLLKWKE